MSFALDDYAERPEALGALVSSVIAAKTPVVQLEGFEVLLRPLVEGDAAFEELAMEAVTHFCLGREALPRGKAVTALACDLPGGTTLAVLAVTLVHHWGSNNQIQAAIRDIYLSGIGPDGSFYWTCRPRDVSGFLLPQYRPHERFDLSAHERLEAPFHPRFGLWNLALLLADVYRDLSVEGSAFHPNPLPQRLLDLHILVRDRSAFAERNAPLIAAAIEEIAELHAWTAAAWRDCAPGQWRGRPGTEALAEMGDLLEIRQEIVAARATF